MASASSRCLNPGSTHARATTLAPSAGDLWLIASTPSLDIVPRHDPFLDQELLNRQPPFRPLAQRRATMGPRMGRVSAVGLVAVVVIMGWSFTSPIRTQAGSSQSS